MGCVSSRATPVDPGYHPTTPLQEGEGGAAGGPGAAGGRLDLRVLPTTPAGGGESGDGGGGGGNGGGGGGDGRSASRSRSAVRGNSLRANGGGGGAANDALVTLALNQKRRGRGAAIFGDTGQVQVQAGGAYVKKHVPKPENVREMLVASLKSNELFGALSANEVDDLVDAMESRAVPAGTIVIQQGDPGDNLYAIQSGKFEIIVDGRKVADWGDGATSKKRTFGELAILYNAPRAATVKAASEAVLWFIDRITFRSVVAQSSYARHNQLKAALRRGLLEDLSDDQLDKIADAATQVNYRKGDQIIRKGEVGEVFFIIETGSVICKNLSGDQANNVLHVGDYFGERALIKKEPRAADVYADSDCSLIALHREDFENLLGHLRDLLERNLGMRLLLCVPILASLSEADRTALFSALKVISHADGHTIVGAGTTPSQFFIVKEGAVLMRDRGASPRPGAPSPNGERDVGVLLPGNWFPAADLAEGRPCGVSYVAQGTVQLFVTDRVTYMRILAPIATTLKQHINGVPSTVAAAGTPVAAAPAAGAAAAPEARSGGGGGARGATGTPVADAPDASIRRLSEGRHSSAYANAASQPPRARLGIAFKELEQKATLGTGTFGRVRLVYHRKTDRVFALKMLQKSQIVALRQQTNIMNEREILWRVDHAFIIKLYDTYKDRDRLYMLLELVQGGELFSRLQNSSTPGRVTPAEARFYGACVLDAFDYLHSLNILYRDLKPENLLIDSDGYLKLVDFGFAKIVADKTYTLCGTPEYLAPELVLGRGHDKGVDYWALGILLYEQVAGYSPFADQRGNDQMVICRNILQCAFEFPSHFRDNNLKDLIQKLLVKDISRRLGCLRGGAGDIKAQRFFRDVEWERLLSKGLAAPWRPKLRNPLDTSNFDEYDEDDRVEPYKDDGSAWDATF